MQDKKKQNKTKQGPGASFVNPEASDVQLSQTLLIAL